MTSSPEQASDASPRGNALAGSARWFAAEFAVVVSGILVALALNALYQSRQQVEREQAYLRQIAAELGESEEQLLEARRMTAENVEQVGQLIEAFSAETPLTIAEFSRLATLQISHGLMVDGAAQALVATGDLHLIRRDATRAAIARFVGLSRHFGEGSREVRYNWILPTFRAMVRRTRPWIDRDHPLSVSHQELLEDPEYLAEVMDLYLALQNQQGTQENVLALIQATRQEVEQALEPVPADADD